MEVDPPSTNENLSREDVAQSNDEDENEYEDFLIMADIGHDIDQQTILEHATNSEIRALDIDGTNPFIQIGPYTFQGQYNYILGTNLFFSTNSSTPSTTTTAAAAMDDNASTSSRAEEVTATTTTLTGNDLNLIGSSDKKLSLSRVYIYPKSLDEPTSTQSKS